MQHEDVAVILAKNKKRVRSRIRMPQRIQTYMTSTNLFLDYTEKDAHAYTQAESKRFPASEQQNRERNCHLSSQIVSAKIHSKARREQFQSLLPLVQFQKVLSVSAEY